MNITIEQLRAIAPTAGTRPDKFVPWLNKYTAEFEINTPLRICAFLAQIAHESGAFVYLRELGSDAYLEKYDTGPIAKALGNTPEDDGDGQKFRGRGLIQITGAANYQKCADALGVDVFHSPELLEQPQYAVASACWFWKSHGLNALADIPDFVKITKRINGGTNGLPERTAYYARAKKVLGVK